MSKNKSTKVKFNDFTEQSVDMQKIIKATGHSINWTATDLKKDSGPANGERPVNFNVPGYTSSY